jgi:glycogen debranching enzyme
MDTMRSSNKGHPVTPRDESAIELVGLCRAILAWLIQMNKEGSYPYDSIQTSRSNQLGKMKISLNECLNKIDENFEKEFWIDESNTLEYVNRKQIYKDTINSSFKWTDFQLRPSFLVAAVVVSFFLHFLFVIFLFIFNELQYLIHRRNIAFV